MANNFGEIGNSPLLIFLAFQNGVEYRNSDFKGFICDDFATSCKNLVNFGPVTPEFKSLKGIYTPRRSVVQLRSLGGATDIRAAGIKIDR